MPYFVRSLRFAECVISIRMHLVLVPARFRLQLLFFQALCRWPRSTNAVLRRALASVRFLFFHLTGNGICLAGTGARSGKTGSGLTESGVGVSGWTCAHVATRIQGVNLNGGASSGSTWGVAEGTGGASLNTRLITNQLRSWH